MAAADCPEFLRPRLRLFLSADIIGSTALKQSRLGALGSTTPSIDASWFTTIQGFYFEAQQIFRSEWERLASEHDAPDHFGDPPELWKTIGDEVLFTKVLTDHRQVAVTLQCWMRTLAGIQKFLTRDNPGLGVKSTAWLAGFPFRNKEVVLSGDSFSKRDVIEDYYKENGLILNKHYANPGASDILIDYVGPSIDTGFRLTALASARKFVVGLEVAYILAQTSPVKGGPIDAIKLRYDGQVFLKGVLGGGGYPVFWLDLSADDSAAVLEDRLTRDDVCDRDAVHEFCDAFFAEHKERIFPPFIESPTEVVITEKPRWYTDKHDNLIKNFNDSYVVTPEPEDPEVPTSEAEYLNTLEILKQRFAAKSQRIEDAREDDSS